MGSRVVDTTIIILIVVLTRVTVLILIEMYHGMSLPSVFSSEQLM